VSDHSQLPDRYPTAETARATEGHLFSELGSFPAVALG
jgi:hypothetical protein